MAGKFGLTGPSATTAVGAWNASTSGARTLSPSTVAEVWTLSTCTSGSAASIAVALIALLHSLDQLGVSYGIRWLTTTLFGSTLISSVGTSPRGCDRYFGDE